jgi:hypothetical protein
MQVFINTGGEGAKIPGIDIGFSVILFDIYISPDTYRGYHGATNDPALGNFSFQTGWIDVPDVSEEKAAKWNNLHGKVIYVKMKPSHFLVNGGLVEFELSQKDYSNGVEQTDTLKFTADNCEGWSIVGGDVTFKCELFQMEEVVG